MDGMTFCIAFIAYKVGHGREIKLSSRRYKTMGTNANKKIVQLVDIWNEISNKGGGEFGRRRHNPLYLK